MAALERRVGLVAHDGYLRAVYRFLARYATNDPDAADFFFAPLNLITFQFANISTPPGVALPDPYESIGALAHLHRGRHLLLSTGDFGQRARSPYEFAGPGRAYPEPYPWLDARFHLLAFESTAALWPGDVALLPWVQRPLERWWRRRWSGPRDLLYSFAGAMAYPQLPPDHIRGGRLELIAGVGDDHFVGSAHDAIARFGWAGTDRNILRRSVFALCPAGFGRWTFRLAQAVYYGAIPVVVGDGYLKPHSRRLDWERFSLTVPEAALETIPELLATIEPAQIEQMQRAGEAHRAQMVAGGALELLAAELVELAARAGASA